VRQDGSPTGGPSQKAGVVGAGNAGTYTTYVQNGYFSLVALNFTDTSGLDKVIAAEVRANKHYKVIDVVPYGVGPDGTTPGTYIIWRLEPAK
jgi:hypothetical protein